MIELMKHQEHMADFGSSQTPIVFNMSDPGTGKTLGTIGAYDRHPATEKKMLVLAPLTILEASWYNDVQKYESFSAAIAHGTPQKRVDVLQKSPADIIITNHDAVAWIAKQPELIDRFTHLVIDESTAYKTHTSRRFKKLMELKHRLSKIRPDLSVTLLTGTPNPQDITDLWSQAFILDSGQRLGDGFFRFRAVTCNPVQVGRDPKARKWVPKEGAMEWCIDKLKDISIRYTLEECTDIPPNTLREITIKMPDKIRIAYEEMRERMVWKTVNAKNAAIKAQKLLQILSGAVYNENKEIVYVHDDRAALVMQLVKERPASLVAFNWKHEKEALIRHAEKEKIAYGVIDGTVPVKERTNIVERFQNGELQVIFAHPMAASHGLTLTRGVATIWMSPTYRTDLWIQFNRRIYRNGQDKKTETIRLAYADSKEQDAYAVLEGKLDPMDFVLSMFSNFTSLSKG